MQSKLEEPVIKNKIKNNFRNTLVPPVCFTITKKYLTMQDAIKNKK